jgi:uncharacterized membrane protein
MKERPVAANMLAVVLWLLVGVYAAVAVLPEAFPRVFASPLKLPLSVLLPLGFALIHGTIRYGAAGTAVFLALCVGVGNVMENLGVLTGFPFGRYHYTDTLGPKLLFVPVLIGPAYFGAGYLAWVLANVLLGTDRRRDAAATFAVPIVGSFIMVGWDVCLDPAAATVRKMWIWENGGGYFGVPLTNFLGWFLTVFIFQQLFALYRVRRPDPTPLSLPSGYWFQPCVLFAAMALSYPAAYFGDADMPVADAAGRIWQTGDIYETATVVSLFTMQAVAVRSFLIVLLRRGRQVPYSSRREAPAAGD